MQTDTLIIGCGPAGLALGRHLAASGHDFLMFDKGQAVQTWSEISPDLPLLTPWWLSAPMREDILAKPIFSRIRADEYYRHLLGHASVLQAHIRSGHRVSSLRRVDGAFEVRGNFETLRCRTVVACTGYYSSPYFPDLPSDGSVPITHAGDYSGIRALIESDAHRILVVGRRITAGQVLEQLHDAGHEVAVAATSAKVTYQRLRKPNTLLETGYYLAEYGVLSIIRGIKVDTYPGMSGGRPRSLIEEGRIPLYHRPIAIRDGQVHFQDGTSKPFDLLVFATGYKPALDYLAGTVTFDPAIGLPATSAFECVESPGLYLLGYDNLVDLRSRSFRGIRGDARRLARILGKARPRTGAKAQAAT